MRKVPYGIRVPIDACRAQLLKLARPKAAAISGISRFLVAESTTAAKAVPIRKPSARSSMLPLNANALN